jgi:flagellar motor switch protein FliM
MSNILTQSEIDELLSALASGESTPQEGLTEDESKLIRSYDFRTANKFSKDQMRTLHFIYENFASRLSTYLSGTLRTICEVDVLSIEEQTFAELSNSMPTPVIVSIIAMPPLQGSVLLEITPVIAYEIVSRLLGGTGQFENTDKAFTEIELSIMERVIQRMLLLMNDAWEKINKINATLSRMETSSQYVQIVSANEPIAIVTLNVKIGEISDIINLCIPHVAVQPIAKKLVMKTWYNSDRDPSRNIEETEDFESRLSGIYLTLQSVFNITHASVRDVLNTKVGDVIQIDHNINCPVTVKVEHIPKFKGAVGIQDSNYAVRIVEILKEDADSEYRDICE